MRINKFVALASGLSRRAADAAIANGRVTVNGQAPSAGQSVDEQDTVTLDGHTLSTPALHTIVLNKPIGYVVSRNGQGSKTIYDLLPPALHHLKPVGRLDKNSSGLLLLTIDGQLTQTLTHPSHQKTKVYEIQLDKPLQPADRQLIEITGVTLADGPSKLQLEPLDAHAARSWRVRMHEGRNRQIRRTFAALGYEVTHLHRTHFGEFSLGPLAVGEYQTVANLRHL